MFVEKLKPSVLENPHKSFALPDAIERHTCTHTKDMQVQPMKDYPWRTQRVSRVFGRYPSHSSPQFKSHRVAGCCLENTVKIPRWELFLKATVRKGWGEGAGETRLSEGGRQRSEDGRKHEEGGTRAKCEGRMIVEGEGGGNKGGEFVVGVKGRQDKRERDTQDNSSVVTIL